MSAFDRSADRDRQIDDRETALDSADSAQIAFTVDYIKQFAEYAKLSPNEKKVLFYKFEIENIDGRKAVKSDRYKAGAKAIHSMMKSASEENVPNVGAIKNCITRMRKKAEKNSGYFHSAQLVSVYMNKDTEQAQAERRQAEQERRQAEQAEQNRQRIETDIMLYEFKQRVKQAHSVKPVDWTVWCVHNRRQERRQRTQTTYNNALHRYITTGYKPVSFAKKISVNATI